MTTINTPIRYSRTVEPPVEPPVADPAPESSPEMRSRPPWRRGLASIPVWLIYVPNLLILKLIGPHWAIVWSRQTARVHYWLTFIGSQRATLRAIRQVHSSLNTSFSPRQVLQKHLVMKHEYFVRLRLIALGLSTDGCEGLEWLCSETDKAKFQSKTDDTKGLMIVGFHFGFFRLSVMTIPDFFPGCEVLHASRRIAHYAQETSESVARFALQSALDVDREAGKPIFRLQNGISPIELFSLLRSGATVAVAADGMFSSEFVEVPFLDGVLRLPTGWARLAAISEAEVVVLSDGDDGSTSRMAYVDDSIPPFQDVEEEVHAAVSQTARILENLIQQQPWGWHPWRRLRWELDEKSIPHYWLTVPDVSAELLKIELDLQSAQ